MLCYGFAPQALLAVLRFPPHRPLLHHVGWMNHHANSHSSEQDTQHIVFPISRQAIPYRIRDGTYCPRLSTPKILSRFGQPHVMMVLTISTIPTFDQTTTSILTRYRSHLDGWKTTSLRLRRKPYLTS
jgi:hypothetical protein